MNNDYLIWIIIFFIFLIIFGLYLSEFTPLNLNEKELTLQNNYNDKYFNNDYLEGFSPRVSSYSSQEKGASRLYKWGLPENNVKKCVKKDTSTDDIPPFTPKPIENVTYCAEEEPCIVKKRDRNCYTCDITTNNDIDKYVLKSSVPPCPDVSKYATKNMIQSCPDISKYILKSEIPSCPKIDKSKYILKSEVPACPKCPVCPVCPICPKCPKQEKCKTISNYNITDHPDYDKYILAEDCPSSESTKSKCPTCPTKECPTSECPTCESSSKKEKTIIEEETFNPNNCNYSKLLDRVFTNKANKVKELQGVYVGDNLFASV